MSGTSDDLVQRLADLRIEHRDLDAAIDLLAHSADADEISLRRLKKRRLRLKDMIRYVEDKLIPDLDA